MGSSAVVFNGSWWKFFLPFHISVCWNVRQCKSECGSGFILIVQLFFLLTFYNDFADGKTQSCTLHLVVGHDETVEYLVYLVIGNTASGIGYMKNNFFSVNLYPKLIEPLAVNFVALPIRLEKTWNKRFLSVEITSDGSDSSKTSSTPGWHLKLYVFLHPHIKYKGYRRMVELHHARFNLRQVQNLVDKFLQAHVVFSTIS